MNKTSNMNDDVMAGGVNKVHSAYFCSECGNLYDITNVPPEANDSSLAESPIPQTGGKQKNEQHITKKIYFVCTTCGNTEIVKPKTLIISKQSQDIAREYFGNNNKPENIVNSSTLLHTRDYICPNKTCSTHVDPGSRDAIMTRIGNSFKIMYICSLCKTSWSNKFT